MSDKKALVQTAGLILAISIIGRLLGFIREQVIAVKFGTSVLTDAYVMGFTIPNLVYVILGGALATAFIPVFTTTELTRGREDSSRIASSVANLTLIVMSVIAVLGVIAAPLLVRLIAPGFSAETRELTITLTRIMFPCVLFATLSMLTGGILNSLKHFTAPAFSSVAFSGTVILAALLLSPYMGIYGLALGTLLATAAQVAIQVPPLFGKNLRYSRLIDVKNEGMKKIGELMAPVLIGSAISQTYIAIDRILASGLPAGSIAALNFANKLMFLPFNLFVTAINTAIFPSLSAIAAKEDLEELGKTMSFGLNLIAIFTIPAAVGLFVLAAPIVRLLFEHGAFNAESTRMTVFALRFFVIGLFAQGAYNILNRTFYSLKDTKTPVKISIFVVLLNLAFSLSLIGPLKHGGLALSNSLAAIANMLLVYWFLRKRLPIPEKSLFLNLGKVLLASGLMGLIVYAADLFLAGLLPDSLLYQMIGLVISITLGAAFYLALLILLKVDDVRPIFDRIMKRLGLSA